MKKELIEEIQSRFHCSVPDDFSFEALMQERTKSLMRINKYGAIVEGEHR